MLHLFLDNSSSATFFKCFYIIFVKSLILLLKYLFLIFSFVSKLDFSTFICINMHFLDIFNKLLSSTNVSVSRFASNVE